MPPIDERPGLILIVILILSKVQSKEIFYLCSRKYRQSGQEKIVRAPVRLASNVQVNLATFKLMNVETKVKFRGNFGAKKSPGNTDLASEQIKQRTSCK